MEKTGQGLVEYAKTKVGTPYFYGAKMNVLTEAYMAQMKRQYPNMVTASYIAKARKKGQVGKVNVDCSGLIAAYTGKMLGSSQLYQQAYARLNTKDYANWANGVVVWRQGHVGVFFKDDDGQPKVIEAKGINYGTVISPFKPADWTNGLTFSWMEYNYNTSATGGATWRGTNPYKEPTENLKKGSKGEGVKWLQWELCEAGFEAEIKKAGGIDGDFGKTTEKCLIAFQKSCKITADAICGPTTRRYLKAN